MFFVLSKLLDLAFSPLFWSLLLGAVALCLHRRRPRGARVAGIAALVLLWAFSTPWLAGVLTRFVERGVTSTQKEGVVYDAVIVLGGMSEPGQTLQAGTPQFGEGVERLLVGREVLLDGQARWLIVTGGVVSGGPPAPPAEADTVAKTLEALGVPGDRILREPRSRNTREDAVFTAEQVRARGLRSLLLVTSAFHMPRAAGCFRAVGLEPDLLPADVRTSALPLGPGGLLPRAEALDDSTRMLRELAGRCIYRVRGYSR